VRRVLVARLVGDQQLDCGPRGRVGEAAGRDEALELVPEGRGEQVVDHLEDLRPRAPVVRQREHLADLVAPLLEDLDIRVQEAVDRLELVPDEEELVARDEVDQLALEPVRVLELVDADLPEAQLLAFADRLVVAKQIAGPQLQVVVIERRLAVLGRLVAALEPLQQLLEQLAIACGDGVQRGLLDRPPGLLVLLVVLDRVLREVEQRLGRRVAVEQLDQSGRVLDAARDGGCAERARVEPGSRAERELERPARRPQRLGDAGQHPPQCLGAVGREQREPVGPFTRLGARRRALPDVAAKSAELRERLVEGLDPEHRGLSLVEHAEARVEPRGERILAEEPGAEPVDRRDPGAVELPRQLGTAELGQAPANPTPQLRGRAVGVGDHEDRADVDAGVDCAREALDEDRRLPCPGACGDEDEPGGADRGILLRSRRAFDRRSHPLRPPHAAHRRELAPRRAAAVAEGVVPDVPLADARDDAAGDVLGARDLRPEVFVFDVVPRRVAGDAVVLRRAAQQPPCLPVAGERLVKPSERLHADKVAQDQHVERNLELELLLDLGGRMSGLA
jgi:hypothetical protein